MHYPILVYKERHDLRLYGFEDERRMKHSSRELVASGIFDGVVIIDSLGVQYELKNVREVGFANSFWGISLIRKGRQIIVDFDLIKVSQKTLEEVRAFVLKRLESRDNALDDELYARIMDAKTFKEIINNLL